MIRLWCLPQLVLFHIVRLVVQAKYDAMWKGRKVYRFDKTKHKFFSGAALFHTIVPYKASTITIAHEHGHHMQGNKWGPLYLLVIGIASLTNNLISRIKDIDYYKRYPEAEADRLGGIIWADKQRRYIGNGS